jgi:hypothetical protein
MSEMNGTSRTQSLDGAITPRRHPMTNPIVHRSIAVLKLPNPVAEIVSIAKAVVVSMTGNPAFPNPQPTLAAINAAIADLETAEAAAKARTHGAVATRNQKRKALVTLLEQLRGYVQTVADADGERAMALIQSAAMNVKKVTPRAQRVFAVKQAALSGAVTLVTPSAGHRSSYEWEFSADGGKTWQALPPTIQAKTSMTGLVAGATYSFRYRSVTRSGAADWSAPVSVVVK